MAFTSGRMADETGADVPFGAMRMVMGWFKSAAGSTGGDIDTGFTICYFFIPLAHAGAVGNTPVVNEVAGDVEEPMGGVVTIVTDTDEKGRWVAFGN